MRIFRLSFFLAATLLPTWAQPQIQNHPPTAQKVTPPKTQFPNEIHLDPKVAEALLVHKEQPACRKDIDGIKIMATVVIAVTIDKNGKVSRTQILSGPKIMRPLALATVRKYLYKPYLVNSTPAEFQTEVSIHIDCVFSNGQA